MTIRGRLTIWYACVLCVSILLIVGCIYYVENYGEKAPFEDKEDYEDFLKAIRFILWYGIPSAILGLAGGWWLMRKALLPITALTKAVEQIHDGNLHVQLARSGNGDELDRLTEVFNSMTLRLNQSFQNIREFTLHASHELKTPLTILQNEVETSLKQANISNPQREQFLSQLDEFHRLTKIVDSLTLLTKADAGQISLTKESVNLDELVHDAYEDAKILAQAKQVDVQLLDCQKINIQGDRHRLRQLLLNLTDNAIKYNYTDGKVTLTLRSQPPFAEFEVTNTGEGIPHEMLPRVFDRFFRCDQSGNHEIDGCGLGLSISQWIVKAHEGTIQISSQSKGLTKITVRIPLTMKNQLI